MKVKTMTAALTAVLTCAVGAAALPPTMDETLVALKPDYEPAYAVWTNRPYKVLKDGLVLFASEQADRRCDALSCMRGTRTYFSAYNASGRAQVSFEYRTKAKKASCAGEGAAMLREENARPYRFHLPLLPADNWKAMKQEFAVSPMESYKFGIYFSLPKGAEGDLEVRRLRVVELPPETNDGADFTADGVPVQEIALLRTADEMRMRNERRAAQALRFAIRRNGGRYLPIREYERVSSNRRGRVFIGAAAEGTGLFSNDFFTDDELKVIRAEDGAGAYAVKNGAVGITGKCPGGPGLGVFRFLGKMGIEYLGTDQWSCETPGVLAVRACREVKVPGVRHRYVEGRNGTLAELRGLIRSEDIVANLAAGTPFWYPHGLSHDSLGFIVPMTEFDRTHPEFFALQPDGTRMNSKTFTNPGITQFCWANPDLIRMIADRYIEIMKATPGAKFYCIAPGDGGDRFCHCENCRKLGSNCKTFVEAMNQVVKQTGAVFPDKVLFGYSYADTLDAPDVAAVDPHFKLTDSIYIPSHWPANHFFKHPANKRGQEELTKWRKLMPDMGVMLYLQCCREPQNVWPGFPGWIETCRDFARHGAFMDDRTYTYVCHAGGFLGNPSVCFDFTTYALNQVEIDPDFDVETAKVRFFDRFYGPAGKPLLTYFNRINQELIKRDWVQQCEYSQRGFITPALADELLPLLEEAVTRAEAIGRPELVFRATYELQLFLFSYIKDVCRGRGNVPSADFPKWAKRVALFFAALRSTGCTYLGDTDRIDKIFADSLLCTFRDPKWNWWTNKQIDDIIVNPAKELGEKLPAMQEKTATGWLIPSKGMLGGEFGKSVTWRREDPIAARVLRRPSSGLGFVMTVLNLEKVPEKDITLRIEGLDGDKVQVAEMEIIVNGKSVFKGPAPFPKDHWVEKSFKLPASSFKLGSNDVHIRNLTPDTEKDGLCGQAFAVERNYFWGWFYIKDLAFDL